jgi:hypothetical protein
MHNMDAQDYGGELDTHGWDLNGNLMASLMYSAHFGSDNTSIEGMQEWNMFVGDDISMLKVCNTAR